MNAAREGLRLSVLDGRMGVCRLAPDSPIPAWATSGGLSSITRTTDELSVACPEASVPGDVRCEKGWRVLKLEGPFEFSEVGVLSSVATSLAGAGVSIFAVSTYDTDYVLVKGEKLDRAVTALREAGHAVRGDAAKTLFRPAAEDDEPFMWEMLYEAAHWASEEPGPKPSPEELLSDDRLRRYLEGWGKEGDFAVVALNAEGGRIGAAWYRLFPASAPGYGFVDAATPEIALAAVPDRRGTGVGGALIDALVGAARSEGFEAISLSVHKSNLAAKLYERKGFVTLRDDGEDRVMKAELYADRITDDVPANGARQTEER